MRWFKKIFRAILNLLPFFFLPIFFVSPSHALQHEYVSIPFSSPSIPLPTSDGSSYFLNWSQSASSSNSTQVVAGFELGFSQDTGVDVSSLNPVLNSSYIVPEYDPDHHSCRMSSSSVLPIWEFQSDRVIGVLPSYYSDLWASYSSDSSCQRFDHAFGSDIDIPAFNRDSFPTGNIFCNRSTGAVCTLNVDVRQYLNSNVMPYWFSYGGAYLSSSAIDSEGFRYSNSLSLKNLFGQVIHRFSYMQVPLWDNDGYFFDSTELPSGRHFDFNGAFEFDGSFSWNPDINNNGSSFNVVFNPISARLGVNESQITVQCSTNLITLSNLTRLEYTCPIDLPTDLIAMYPVLVIDGNGSYVFDSSADWRFSYTYLTTDYDTTPGRDFNSHVPGGGAVPGDASNQISDSDPDWFSSLTNLFTFSFLNPFAPLFNLFTSGDQCASIPTIAGMLHSSETTVCPWFSPTIRNIVTPVLGLSSMMLLFGFLVRWLGSHSGNMFDDSMETDNYRFESQFSRSRGGKK